MTPNNQLFFGFRKNQSVIPFQIGDLVTPTYNNPDYTDSDITVSHNASGGEITISGTDAAIFGKYVTFDNLLTSRENYTLTIYDYAANVAINSIGIGIGVSSDVGGALYQKMCVIGLDSTLPGTSNQGNFYLMETSASPSTIISQTGPDASFVDNLDMLRIVFKKDGNHIDIKCYNDTKNNTPKSLTYDHIYGVPVSTPILITPMAKPMFYFFGGTHTFKWSITTEEYKYSDLMVGIDSCVVSYSTGGISQANSVAALMRAAYPSKYIHISAGVNETTDDLVARIPDTIVTSKPKNYLILSFRNDEISGINHSVTIANLTTFRAAVIANGGKCWCCYVANEAPGGTDLTPQNAIVDAVFLPSEIVDLSTFDPTTGNATDKRHWVILGNLDIFTDVHAQVPI